MNEEKYRDAYRNIVLSQHAPETLIEKTMERTRGRVQGGNSRTFPWRKRFFLLAAAAAVCILFLTGGVYLYHTMQDASVYSEVGTAAADGSGSTLNLGQNILVQQDFRTGLSYRFPNDAQELPAGLISGKPQDMEGLDVYFGEDRGDDTLYAAFEDERKWVLLSSTGTDKEAFSKKVKEYIDSHYSTASG